MHSSSERLNSKSEPATCSPRLACRLQGCAPCPPTPSRERISTTSGRISRPIATSPHVLKSSSLARGPWAGASGGAFVNPLARPATFLAIRPETTRSKVRRGAAAEDITIDAPAAEPAASSNGRGASGSGTKGDGGRGSDGCGSGSGGGGGGGSLDSCEDELGLNLADCRHFVNLTNGIEALPMLHELGLPYSFVRIQSTACEQQNLEALVSELDANLLISLALGHCCLVYDCGSRGRDGTPRALWYGLEFVRYTLSKLWLRRPCPALLRGKNVARNFDTHIRSFRQSTVRRLQYYSKYLPPGSTSTDVGDARTAVAAAADAGGDVGGGAGGGLQRLRLYGALRPTDHDHDASHFVRLLHQHQLPPRPTVLGQLPRPTETAAGQQLPTVYDVGSGVVLPSGGRPLPAGLMPLTGSYAATCSTQMQGSGGGEVWNATGGGGGSSGGGNDDGAADGEVVLAEYGFRLFRRGLSPAEWAARREQGAAAPEACGERDGAKVDGAAKSEAAEQGSSEERSSEDLDVASSLAV